jgi:predicted ATPase
LAERVVRQGERQESLELLAMGSQMLAMDFVCQGRLRLALAASERALAIARAGLVRNWKPTAMEQVAISPLAIQAFATLNLTLLGRLEQARRYGREVMEQARRIGHLDAMTLALSNMAMASQLRRDVQETSLCSEEARALSSERSHWTWKVWERVLQGWALAELGQPREGLALIGQEIARWREWGARGMLPYFLGLLAEIHLKLGQLRAGLRVVQEALSEAQATGERFFEAELYRLRGELLRGLGREARHDFSRAITVAREQEALLFELRATVSLGRLLRDTEHPEVARGLLTRLLTRFEVGEDSVDLTEARALLDGRSAEWGAAPR